MNPSRALILSRSWLILGLVVGFVLAAGTAILSSVSTRNLAVSSARIDQQLADLHRSNVLAPHTGNAAATVERAHAGQRELSRLAHDSAEVTRRALLFQRVSVALLVAACALGGAGALLLRRRVQQFEDMITVCAWTKRVRFNDRWVSFEDYLHARFNLQFTHGISEDAAAKIQRETADLMKRESRATTPKAA
jgi:hypothetical protein